MKQHTQQRKVLAFGLAMSLAVLLLVLRIDTARAGGNTQFRNPANLSEVITKTWDTRMIPITWVLSEDGLPGSSIDNATLTSELTAAFDTWEALTTSAIDFEFGGEVPIRTTGLDGPLGSGIDGLNLVTFTDPEAFFPPGVLAVATTFAFSGETVIDATNSDLDGDGSPDIPEGTYPAGTIFDGDIAFNSSEDWSVSGAASTLDIRAVALHEIGHAVGLAHSMIRDAVMWPFLASDISAARTPKVDDIAYASYYYQNEPAYSAIFGSISGQVINGFSTSPVLGAHVYAVDPVTGDGMTGAYSGDDGSYLIPGLSADDYLVAIEPLDGDPMGLDPFRINEVVRFTFDTDFPEEFYDANESNVEADAQAGLAVNVSAGANSAGIDLVTNNLQVPGVNVILEPGYNLFGYPVEVPAGLRAFELLQAIGDETEINAIDRFVPASGSFERAEYINGVPSGVDFDIRRAEGYVVHMAAQKVVLFSGGTDCPDLDLSRGMNLIGVPCPPAGYGSHQLLQDIGARFEIDKLQGFEPGSGTFQTSQYDPLDQPIGDDFPVSNGKGYIATMLADKSGLQIPAPGSNFPPVISGLTPGQGVPGTIVVVLGEGFDPDVTKNTVTFNGVGASAIFATSNTVTATVPSGASTGPVRVSVAGLQSNAIDFEVESPSIVELPGSDTPLVSGQTADGTLSLDGEQDRYTFTALAGSLATISASATTSGVPDLVLLLEDPFGVVVATDDNSGGGTDALINNFVLPTTGTYTIVVSNIPGSGLGSYQLSLNISTRTTEPRVSIIGGNFQTGLGGTTLPVPLSVLVTGATGAPVSGASVNFVATDLTFGMSNPIAAGTTIVDTNASGIVTVGTTLPSGSGQYTITVTVDGVVTSETFVIAGSNKQVATVEMVGDQQTGPVDQELANPLEIIAKDNLGEFVADALVAFRVVSGGGEVGGTACTGRTYVVCDNTGAADGKAGATFTLGQKIDQSQIVAAFVPGLIEPLLFEAIPEADVADSLHSNTTNFKRMTLGTSVLNAMQIRVFDKFENPVSGVQIFYSPGGGLQVYPGLGPNGEAFTDFRTNEDGLHVAMVSAPYGSVTPTVNEFDEAVNDGPRGVIATVQGGNSPTENFAVDVDMGPGMVTWSGQNISHIFGQPLPTPVTKRVLRWNRVDTHIDANSDGWDDDDNGDFRDEDYDPLNQIGISGVTINLEARREDGYDEADHSLTPMTLSSATAVTDSGGYGSVDVTTMGDVGGVKEVVGRIDEILIEWFFEDGTPLYQKPFNDEHDFGEATNLIAVPVTITVDLNDPHSGIDFSTVVALLNGTVFFDPAVPPAVLRDFPEPMQVIVGGESLVGLTPELIGNSRFNTIRITYQPSAPKLVTGDNEVVVQQVKDKAENEQTAPESTEFTYP